jgi:hypothetical protein
MMGSLSTLLYLVIMNEVVMVICVQALV